MMSLDHRQFKKISPHLLNIRDWLRWSVSQLSEATLCYGHGTDNAWDEAIALLTFVLKWPGDLSEVLLDARVLPEEAEAFYNIIAQRIEKRYPAPYLTNLAHFSGLQFYVDERVLIPRSPIAELIEARFSPWAEGAIHSILDLCAGSGCIGVACAYAFPEAQVDLVDLSEDALAVAEKNVKKHEAEDRIKLIQSDLFERVAQQYDVIVSNPPYVDQHDMDCLPEEFQHEPRMALEAGNDGLDIVLRLLNEAPDYLTEAGILIVEVGNSANALVDLLPDVPLTWLNFERGGEGVFLMSKKALIDAKEQLAAVLKVR